MVKSKLKIFGLLAVICAFVCCAFAGCSLLQNIDYEEIYNDDAKIVNCNTNVCIDSFETWNKGVYTLKCLKLSGVFHVNNLLTVDEETSATLTFKTMSGKCKVVLVKDKVVYTIAEGSYDGALELEIPYGDYRVNVVGVDANFNLILS
nr:hypothetical protein [Clostridia bacterium]